MKSYLIAILTTFMMTSAFAAEPAEQTATVARLLINNPTIVNRLKKENTVGLQDIQVRELRSGVTRYRLIFNRQCFCIPKTATVDIVEDMTGTYADGPIKYRSSIRFSSAN